MAANASSKFLSPTLSFVKETCITFIGIRSNYCWKSPIEYEVVFTKISYDSRQCIPLLV